MPNSPWNIVTARWDWGDGSSSNSLYTSHQYAAAGLYNICLSVTVSCVATSSSCTSYSVYRVSQEAMIFKVNVVAPELVMGLSSTEADEQLSWNIVPNPNTGTFNLNHAKAGTVRVLISDLTGRLVHEQLVDVASAPVQTSGLPPGMYLVTLEAENYRVTKRMIVNH